MIVFNVVKEQHGWAVRMADHMSTPFWSRDVAILEANALAQGIRSHGQCAEVAIESLTSSEEAPKAEELSSSWSDAFTWRRRMAAQ